MERGRGGAPGTLLCSSVPLAEYVRACTGQDMLGGEGEGVSCMRGNSLEAFSKPGASGHLLTQKVLVMLVLYKALMYLWDTTSRPVPPAVYVCVCVWCFPHRSPSRQRYCGWSSSWRPSWQQHLPAWQLSFWREAAAA